MTAGIGEAGAGAARYAGFWVRAWAQVIDTVLYLIFSIPVLAVGYGLEEYLNREGSEFIKGPLDLVVTYILPCVVILACWLLWSATPGKMLCRLRIVDDRTGGRPTAVQLVIRWVGYVVAAVPLCLGLLLIGFDARKQGWHDKMAGTLVTKVGG